VDHGRRLVLIRHAKAEPFAATDRERQLTDRGHRDAREAGGYLREQGIVPDYAVVSSADRTRQTWEGIELGLGAHTEVTFDDAVYSGSPDVVLEALRTVPESARALVFVGHQPTVGYVAHLLEDGAGDAGALHRMLHGFPTASMAIFEIGCAWEVLGAETGRLVDFRPGRG
jgi:phosphohistidine phosphatase